MAKATATPTMQMSIEGLVFEVAAPYAEGHTVTEAEAKALNQMRKENIGNNVRKAIKDLKGDAEEFTAEQAEQATAIVAEKDANYEFTLSSARGTSKDPLEVMATRLAREAVNTEIQRQGQTVKAYKEANADKYDELVASVSENPQIIELAKQRIAQRDALTSISLG
jgi:hypothetical protein